MMDGIGLDFGGNRRWWGLVKGPAFAAHWRIGLKLGWGLPVAGDRAAASGGLALGGRCLGPRTAFRVHHLLSSFWTTPNHRLQIT